MFLYQSNQLEILALHLRTILQDTPSDPFIPEVIVVQHQGMAQWISQQLAFADGIAANLRFPLPARLIWTVLQDLTGATPTEDLFKKSVLRWRIAGLLPSFLTHPKFGEITTYLTDDDSGEKLYQLAGRISDIIDQYQVYRPEMLDQWQQVQGDHWQAVLWQALTADTFPQRAYLGRQVQQLLNATDNENRKLLPRYHLFGLNSLAPVYLDIFARLGQLTAVHCYHLSPCRQYWGDIMPARHQAGLRARQQLSSTADTYLEQGHPLLASLGKTGQDFFEQLLALDDIQSVDLHLEDEQGHLLAVLRNDILDLHDRTSGEHGRYHLDPDDRSLQFHCCASPFREIQVLHDRLLDLMLHYPDLTPGDILVCAPDIQLYADAIAGVFNETGREHHIPWSIADQSPDNASPLVRCFLDVLDLFVGRFTAPDVLALCETAALLRRFSLDSTLLPLFHDWVSGSGIRWGLDEAHRHDLAVQDGHLHSWQFGLDRLVLGYLMGNCQEPQAGILPYAVLTAGHAEDLGGFATLVTTLAHWRRMLHAPRPAAQWTDDLLKLLESLFAPSEEDEEGLLMLQTSISSLHEDCQAAGYHTPLSFAVVAQHLKTLLSQTSGGHTFLSGKLTFCNMVPMRSVPFRVLCLLGMNDQSFPRSQHPPAFDLIAKEPRLGDRNRRQDDRYLFLEALLSARHVLYLSWVGGNLRDETLLPPSAVLVELMDYLDQSCVLPESTGIADHLTTIHPVQPFSYHCFAGNPAIAGYNPAWLPAAEEHSAIPFLTSPLPEPDTKWHDVSLQQLIRFWQHPCRFFLEHILGLRLRNREVEIAESEPFSLNNLQNYHLRQATVTDLLTGVPLTRINEILTSAGQLPHGNFDRISFEQIAGESISFSTAAEPLLSRPLPPLEIDVTIGSYRVSGRLDNCFARGRVVWRTGHAAGRDLLALWIPHLLLNLLCPDSMPPVSIHLSRHPKSSTSPVHRSTLGTVPDPEQHLLWLLERYQRGLSQPLPFFAETSLAWARAKRDKKNPEQAARQTWEDGFLMAGEGSDPAHRLCFEQLSFAANTEFLELTDLYTTLLAHLEVDADAAA